MHRQRLRIAIALIGVAHAGAALAWPSAPDAVAAAGCTNLDAILPLFTLDYQAAIQGVFDAYCTGCHEGDAPPAGLDLSPGVSWSQLVGRPSTGNPDLMRVVPDHPEASLLFEKVNCDLPAFGARMPFGAPALPDDLQALIADWIAAGAPPGATDTLFRGGFEPRG